jgi:hypothetical protein
MLGVENKSNRNITITTVGGAIFNSETDKFVKNVSLLSTILCDLRLRKSAMVRPVLSHMVYLSWRTLRLVNCQEECTCLLIMFLDFPSVYIPQRVSLRTIAQYADSLTLVLVRLKVGTNPPIPDAPLSNGFPL